jgi:hypothetical protein
MEAENYWVYRITVTLLDGSVEVFPYLDSVRIDAETTLMNGTQYWVRRGTQSGETMMRDSADCVILGDSNLEQIIYSTSYDTLINRPPIYKIMTNVGETITVPAGEFRSSNCMTIVRKSGATGHSHLPSFNNEFYIGEQYICSPDIGLIKRVYYYLGNTVETELVRYKIK